MKEKRLIVLGNGFDLSHGIASRYNEFRSFLMDRYGASDEIPYLNYPQINKDGELDCSEIDSAKVLFCLVEQLQGEEWNDFENCLSRIDLDELFDQVDIHYDKEEDEHYSYNESLYGQLGDTIYSAFSNLNKLLFLWVNSIHENITGTTGYPPKAIESLDNLFNKGVFLTFNYTLTLEEVYNINEKRICHIHGCINNSDELIIGHGELEESLKNEESYFSIFETKNEVHNLLAKDSETVIKRNYDFFLRLSGIEEIYLIGFSLSKPDELYISTILELVDKEKLIIYLTKYCKKTGENKRMITTLNRLGYTGTIGYF